MVSALLSLQLLCRFLGRRDVGLSPRADGRRRRSAKARSRGEVEHQRCNALYGDLGRTPGLRADTRAPRMIVWAVSPIEEQPGRRLNGIGSGSDGRFACRSGAFSQERWLPAHDQRR